MPLGVEVRSSLPREVLWEPSGGISLPLAHAELKTIEKETKNRGIMDKTVAWIRFVGGPGELAGSALGELIVKLIKKGK